MKLKISKKKLKSLSKDLTTIPATKTAEIGGGDKWSHYGYCEPTRVVYCGSFDCPSDPNDTNCGTYTCH
ncbi:hypothetical protein L1285_08865 [Pseudoalteromonas sp. DL2-H2.2]|uniref:hypothetical protein n=1 Tax=Pseudoalteromonas sp. DL2-H2.2 TaxID=2908889 RepID=UPI001F35EF4A|nr:hypothetical protein [Pseudoalteromonas sp. DL2-H2.2]MCF2908433.1 hypothetical protein [Pseudoalteromonas sp. DL2-H2.2]